MNRRTRDHLFGLHIKQRRTTVINRSPFLLFDSLESRRLKNRSEFIIIFAVKLKEMTIKDKPLILITNDDGINAKGIEELTISLKGLGEIVVFAPDGPRSGSSWSQRTFNISQLYSFRILSRS